MSWAHYELPIHVHRSRWDVFSSPVEPSALSVIVPVKDDPSGLAQTLESLANLDPPPHQVIVVDDGSSPAVDCCLHLRSIQQFETKLLRLSVNHGAAAARNIALRRVKGGWVYFTDCGCTHRPDLLARFSEARSTAPDAVVALAGPIVGAGQGRIARYMTEQGNLNPPVLNDQPQALVTANALVWQPAAALVGGFDERFPSAGGEDLDFGLSLRHFGVIAWARRAVVQHGFSEDIDDFDRRFARYGRGLRILADKWRVDLSPYSFKAYSPDLQDLADRQTAIMTQGYLGAHHV